MINWCQSVFQDMLSLLPGESQDLKVKLESWEKRQGQRVPTGTAIGSQRDIKVIFPTLSVSSKQMK